MTARLFSAVLPPLDVLEQIDAHLQPRRAAGSGTWRWTPMENWHVTTAFMASVPERAREPLDELLAEAAAATPAFDIRLAGTVCFPDPSRARILALGVTQGAQKLAALAQRCRNAATRAGTSADGARYTGHLTLARTHRATEATSWVRIVDSFPGWSWTAQELVLIESHLAERRYEVVGRWPLAVVRGAR